MPELVDQDGNELDDEIEDNAEEEEESAE